MSDEPVLEDTPVDVEEQPDEVEEQPSGPSDGEPDADEGEAAPAETTVLDLATWAAIVEAREEERECEQNVLNFSEELKAAKKRLEVVSARLGALIDSAKEPNLFNLPKPDAPAEGETPAEDPDAWRTVGLEELLGDDLTEAKLELLRAHGISAFGQLEDARRNDDWPKGFGPAIKQKVEDRIVAYWTAHPRPVPAPAANTGQPPAPEPSQDTPAAPDASTETAERSYTLPELNFTEETVKAILYPRLLAELENKRLGKIGEYASFRNGLIPGDWIAVPDPARQGQLLFLPLVPLNTFDRIEEGNPFGGRMVGDGDMPRFQIGAAKDFMRVSVK